MNLHASEMKPTPDRDDAREALALLRAWAGSASPEEVADLDPAISRLLTTGEVGNYPLLRRDYPEDFAVDARYRASLPDLQNGPASLIRGTKQQLQHVGISNFRLPIRFHTRDNGDLTLETSVTGTVSLEAGRKGINMSRIMRSFYKHAEKTFSLEVMEAALADYITDLDSVDARLQMRISYPAKVRSLRSGLEGFQYYDIAMELIEADGAKRKFMHLDYVYSSTCPCSRGARATGHAAFAALGRADFGRGAGGRLPVVRGFDRPRAPGGPHRDAGDGQARGRTGLCRAERRQSDLCRGRGATVLRAVAGGSARWRFPGDRKPSGEPAQP